MLTLACLVGSLCASPPLMQDGPLRTLEEIDRLVSEHYFDKKFAQESWPKLLDALREKVKKAADTGEAYRFIYDGLQDSGHSHFMLIPALGHREESWWNVPAPFMGLREPGFSLHAVEGAWCVTRVDPEGPAWDSGLRPGTALETINENRIDEWPWSVMNWLRLHSYMMKSIELELWGTLAGETAPRFFAIPYEPLKREVVHFGKIKLPTRTEFTRKGQIGILHFDAFVISPVAKVKNQIRKWRDLEGLVLDLRDNTGGMGMLACAVALEFASKDFSLGEQVGRDLTLQYPVVGQKKYFAGPVAVLINAATVSTAEILARGLQVEGRAKVFGEKTAGMVLPSVLMELGDGSVFQFPIGDFKDARGQLLEGRGVVPDVEIHVTRNDLAQNRDVVLEAALEWLASQTAVARKDRRED